MTMDEIMDLVNSGQPINPLLWEPGDRLRYCVLTIEAMGQLADQIFVSIGGGTQWPGDPEYVEDLDETFRAYDRFMLMAHNVHTIMQSCLTAEERQQILKEKAELMTGQPIKSVQSLPGPLGAVLAIEFEDESMVPDDLGGLIGE